MKMFLTPQEWINRCEVTDTWKFEEALTDLRDSMPQDCQCKYSSAEIAEYLIKWEGGFATLSECLFMLELCFDITYWEINEE